MRANDIDLVRQLPLFQSVSPERFALLTSAAFLQRFPPHMTLINEGEPPDFLHVVVEGWVELYSHHEGRRTTVSFVHPVSTFILAAVATDKPYLNSARTIAPSRILMIPLEAVHRALAEDASFARAVVTELAGRYRDVVKELKNQKLRTSVERLAAWILVNGTSENSRLDFTIPFEKGLLAAYLGVSRENLSRNFATLAAYGVVVDGRRVRCDDVRALEGLAKPSRLIDDRAS